MSLQTSLILSQLIYFTTFANLMKSMLVKVSIHTSFGDWNQPFYELIL